MTSAHQSATKTGLRNQKLRNCSHMISQKNSNRIDRTNSVVRLYAVRRNANAKLCSRSSRLLCCVAQPPPIAISHSCVLSPLLVFVRVCPNTNHNHHRSQLPLFSISFIFSSSARLSQSTKTKPINLELLKIKRLSSSRIEVTAAAVPIALSQELSIHRSHRKQLYRSVFLLPMKFQPKLKQKLNNRRITIILIPPWDEKNARGD